MNAVRNGYVNDVFRVRIFISIMNGGRREEKTVLRSNIDIWKTENYH